MKSSHRRDIAAGHIPTERKPSLQWCDYFTLEFYGWGNGFSRDIPRSGYFPLVGFKVTKRCDEQAEQCC